MLSQHASRLGTVDLCQSKVCTGSSQRCVCALAGKYLYCNVRGQGAPAPALSADPRLTSCRPAGTRELYRLPPALGGSPRAAAMLGSSSAMADTSGAAARCESIPLWHAACGPLWHAACGAKNGESTGRGSCWYSTCCSVIWLLQAVSCHTMHAASCPCHCFGSISAGYSALHILCKEVHGRSAVIS